MDGRGRGKMTAVRCLLVRALAEPESTVALSLRDWEILIWQGRAAELLGQLRHLLDARGLLARVPAPARRHFDMAWAISERHAEAVHYELGHLRDALGSLGVPVVLLKGAAYCVQNSLAARGRVFNDIDILVPRPSLDRVEKALAGAGWLPTHLNAYDQHYYRAWMHEIPPMEHNTRSTVLDVHHTIVPPTSGIRFDPAVLIELAVVPGEPAWSFFRVLAPEDRVMHSACHLFFGEFHKGLRDLYDLHCLFSECSGQPDFWHRLHRRSESLGLLLPVADALREAHHLFGTRVAADVLERFSEATPVQVAGALRGWLFEQVLKPPHPSADNKSTRLARWLAFIRSHWLRMPLPLLIYHLGHKALESEK